MENKMENSGETNQPESKSWTEMYQAGLTKIGLGDHLNEDKTRSHDDPNVDARDSVRIAAKKVDDPETREAHGQSKRIVTNAYEAHKLIHNTEAKLSSHGKNNVQTDKNENSASSAEGKESENPAAAAPGSTRLEAGNKVLISNLDPVVLGPDIQEIFQNLGTVTKAVVHYDSDRRSLGTAEVTFANAATATKAVEEYDGAEVDG